MNEFLQSIIRGIRRLRPFQVVAPWEQGIRVRFGKSSKLLNPGWHWIIPMLDRVLVHGIQRTTVNIPMQTVTTADGVPVTIAGACAYSIKDLTLLYKTLHCPDDAIISFSQSAIAKFITARNIEKLRPEDIAKFVVKDITLQHYGLSDVEVFITDMVRVKTYRLISDNRYGSYGNVLRLTGKPE